MSAHAYAVVVILSFAVALPVTWTLSRGLRGLGVLDRPNERSLHRSPTPRGGGIGVIAGVLAGWLVCRWLELPFLNLALVVGASLVALVGAADDYRGGISPRLRIAAQLIAASLVVVESGGLAKLPLPPPADLAVGLLGTPLALIWILGVTNLYNFLDGIDGLAASQGVIAGAAAALLFPGTGIASVGWSLAGASAGFLLLNWHPARIFLGDTGSATIGFVFAVLPFQLAPQDRSRAVFFVAICLWFFLADGTFTLLRRAIGGHKVWTAHQSHLYQRLVKVGLRHDSVVLAIIAFSAPLAPLAIAAGSQPAAAMDWAVLALSVGLFLLYLAWTRKREARLSRFRYGGSAHPSVVT